MTQHALWVSYGGAARIALVIVLLAAVGGLAYAGTRFRRPVRLPRPSRTLTVSMLLAWVLAMGAFLAGFAAYVQQERHEHILKAAPTDPVQLVTMTAAVILFVIVFIAAPADPTPHGLWVRLSSGVIAAMAAPMIFELPFDLIVMTRTYPLVAPDPALYRALFFAPLVLVELTTLSLLTTTMARLSRPAICCLALMLLVFAAWALAGFSYPSAPLPIAMNDVSKILTFVTTLSLFFPEWFTWRRRNHPVRGGGQAPATPEPQPHAA